MKEYFGNTAVLVENGGKDPLGFSVSVTKSAGKLVVSLVNPRGTEEVSAECELPGITVHNAIAPVLYHPDHNVASSSDAPATIRPKPHPERVEAGKILVDLPSLSVVTVVVKLV